MIRSRGRWIIPLLVVSVLFCSLIAPATATGAASDTLGESPSNDGISAPASPALETIATQEFDADRTEFRITVYENGSATWQFRYEQRLTTDQQRTDFEAFAEEFNTNETDLYLNFRNRAQSLTNAGTNATDRQMSAEGFQRDARTEELGPAGEPFGVVEMSFTWRGFALAEGDSVLVGDTFEGGLYIGPNQTLVFERGPTLAFRSVRPDDGIRSGETLADSDSVTWEGERTFTDNRPRLEFVPRGQLSTPTEGPSTTQPPAESDPGWLLPVGILVVVALLGVAGVIAYRSGVFSDDGGGATSTSGNDAGGTAQAGGSAAGGAATGGVSTEESEDADDADTGPAAIADEELVPDEERVVSLLEENGGRMKQVNIVEETGWSKSKVSMLLSDMEDEETISKLRVGRENIVSLAGHEPDAAGSPFDDEES